jgi:hypothetical protein
MTNGFVLKRRVRLRTVAGCSPLNRRKEWCASAPYGFDLKRSEIFSAASSPVRTQSEMPTP